MKLSVIGLRGFPSIEGGVEKHSESLYPKLAKDIDVTVYRRKVYVKGNGDYSNIHFVDLPSTRIKGFEAFFHSLISTIHALRMNPDVVHYHNIGPSFFSPLIKMKKIPVVITYHSANYEHKKWGAIAKKFLRLCEKIALKTADRIIFVNRFQMDKYDDEIKKKSIYVPNGIDELPHSTNIDFLEKIGVEKGKYILSVGRITPEKGFDTLIKAFKIAEKNGFKLVIAGGVEFEDSYMKELEDLSKETEVIFTGYTFGEDLYQLYTHAGMYVLASNNEGFPIVLLEAMKYGLDVLVTNIPATHLVDLDEDDYFACGDYRDLAEKISVRIKETKKRKYDLSDYNWNQIAEIMTGIYTEVTGESHD